MEIMIVDFLFDLGRTLGVGASTFALIFYFVSIADGEMNPTERKFLHIVYRVLRVGMSLLGVSLILGYFYGMSATPLEYAMRWTLLIVITLNAILMTKHVMPMKFGPTIAGGSWYSLFFVSALPVYMLGAHAAVVLYIAFLVVLHLFLGFVGKKVRNAHTA